MGYWSKAISRDTGLFTELEKLITDSNFPLEVISRKGLAEQILTFKNQVRKAQSNIKIFNLFNS